MGHGLTFAGIEPIKVEWMREICQVLRLQNPQMVIGGDISLPAMQVQKLKMHPAAGILAAGIGSQQYSQQGDSAGGADSRARILSAAILVLVAEHSCHMVNMVCSLRHEELESGAT